MSKSLSIGSLLLKGTITICLSLAGYSCCDEPFEIPGDETDLEFFRVFVSNASSSTVSVINTETLTEETVIDATVAGTSLSEPRNLAVSPDGTVVYIPFRFTNNILVVDTQTNSVLDEITHASFDEPYALAFTPSGNEVWVVNKQGGGSSTGSITIINATTRAVAGEINDINISSPEGIAIANGKAYVANRGDGTVSVFSVSSRTFITSLNTGGQPRFAAATPNQQAVFVSNVTGGTARINTSDNTFITIAAFGRNLCISPDGLKVFIGTQSAQIDVINVTDNTVSAIAVPVAFSIYGVAISSRDNLGFATDESRNVVYVFNPVTQQLIDNAGVPLEIPVGSVPRAIAAY
jgi:YVTN family beta-propeller protein